jgi:hypothetical protein
MKPEADPETVYKVRFFVAAAPEDCSKLVQLYDSKKGVARKATSTDKAKGSNESLVLNIPLLVKDQSTMLSNHFTKINVVVQQTSDNKNFSGFFGDITPEKVLKHKDSRTVVNDSLKLLQKFNVWVEATVKCSADGVIMLTNQTQLKEF